jgi:hypothetical protein
MSETESTSTRKRSSSKSGDESSGDVVVDYDEALEKGYIGGPIDEEDHTVAGEIAAAEKAKKEAGD